MRGEPGAQGPEGATGAPGPQGPGFDIRLGRLARLGPAELPTSAAVMLGTFSQQGLLASFTVSLDAERIRLQAPRLVEAWAVGLDGTSRFVTGLTDLAAADTLRWRCDPPGASTIRALLTGGGALWLRVDGDRLFDIARRPVVCSLVALAFPTMVLPPGGQLHLVFPAGA